MGIQAIITNFNPLAHWFSSKAVHSSIAIYAHSEKRGRHMWIVHDCLWTLRSMSDRPQSYHGANSRMNQYVVITYLQLWVCMCILIKHIIHVYI